MPASPDGEPGARLASAEPQRRQERAGRAMLGLGANLGRPGEQIGSAIDALDKLLADLKVSRLYRSEPVGHREQPDFVNCVCVGFSSLCPAELLRQAQRIEDGFGRTRTFRNAPRTLDIDLLAFDDYVMETPELTLPHPRLHERAFVLVPLAELAPDWRHPLLGLTAAEMLHRLSPTRVEALDRIR